MKPPQQPLEARKVLQVVLDQLMHERSQGQSPILASGEKRSPGMPSHDAGFQARNSAGTSANVASSWSGIAEYLDIRTVGIAI